MSLAYLQISYGYTTGSRQPNYKTYPITVISLGRGYNSQLQSSTVRTGKHYYPIRTKENDLQFTIQCRSEAEYDTLRTAIANAQRATVETGISNGVIRFIYPAYGLDYLGYVPSISAGVRRFDMAPTIPISMMLIKDTINTVTSQYSSLGSGKWQDIYGTSIVDMYAETKKTLSDADRIAAEHGPTQPISSGGGGRPWLTN